MELIRALSKVGYSPKQLFQASSPSFADQYSDAIVDNTEAFYAVSYHVDADAGESRSSSRRIARKYDTDPEDAADMGREALQKAVEEVGEIDQDAIKDWLHANSVDTILGLPVGRDRSAGAGVPPRPVAERGRGDRAAGISPTARRS